jgi:hypothetical protein
MIEKAAPVSREKIGRKFGQVDTAILQTVNRVLMVFFALESTATP